MFTDAVLAKYSMTADIMQLVASQDPDSGRIIKDWAFQKTIQCYAQTIESNKASDTEAGQKSRRVYTKHEIISIKLSDDIDDRCRITNIRTSDGTLMWKETEFIDTPATVFEINSVEPIIDQLGRIIEYQIQAHRIEVQRGS